MGELVGRKKRIQPSSSWKRDFKRERAGNSGALRITGLECRRRANGGWVYCWRGKDLGKYTISHHCELESVPDRYILECFWADVRGNAGIEEEVLGRAKNVDEVTVFNNVWPICTRGGEEGGWERKLLVRPQYEVELVEHWPDLSKKRHLPLHLVGVVQIAPWR